MVGNYVMILGLTITQPRIAFFVIRSWVSCPIVKRAHFNRESRYKGCVPFVIRRTEKIISPIRSHESLDEPFGRSIFGRFIRARSFSTSLSLPSRWVASLYDSAWERPPFISITLLITPVNSDIVIRITMCHLKI